jgi:hypothetical protein
MRPGIPHFVYGLEDTVIHGGHFYSTSLMQQTEASLIHTFVLSNFISNTFHPPSRQLLRRIVTFWGLALLEDRLTPQGKQRNSICIAHDESSVIRRRVLPSP